MKKSEKAVETFKTGLNCAQGVLSSFAGDFGLDEQKALKVAAGFGAGMGRMAMTCGAVTGAFMVIGLKHGATRGDDQEGKERTHQVVREFVKRFKARNGSITCRELLQCDISTPEGFEQVKQAGRFKTVCPKLVSDAVEILEELV